MFCSTCGNQLAASSVACPHCNAPVRGAPLERPLAHRVLGGVCAAFAQRYGWRVRRVRLAAALIALFTCVGGLAYLIAWFVIPSEPYPTAAKSF